MTLRDFGITLSSLWAQDRGPADWWLAGSWLAGWPAGWMARRLAGRLAGLHGWLADWPADWLADWLAGSLDSPEPALASKRAFLDYKQGSLEFWNESFGIPGGRAKSPEGFLESKRESLESGHASSGGNSESPAESTTIRQSLKRAITVP